jgi:hypothetical protein
VAAIRVRVKDPNFKHRRHSSLVSSLNSLNNHTCIVLVSVRGGTEDRASLALQLSRSIQRLLLLLLWLHEDYYLVGIVPIHPEEPFALNNLTQRLQAPSYRYFCGLLRLTAAIPIEYPLHELCRRILLTPRAAIPDALST